MIPPKPPARPDKVPFWRHLRLFRTDILSSQPARLYRAWMAEFRTLFFRSYLCNDPDLVELVLKLRPEDFPKSNRIRAGLAPLLGNSVFLTNGEVWARQRRIIDPAFEGGRLRAAFPAIHSAGAAAVARLGARAGGEVEIEAETSHAAADVIFRTLFSIPIEDAAASAVFNTFQAHQRSQPILNLAAFLPVPNWFPKYHRRATKATARHIRQLITAMTEARQVAIAAGTAPEDLATKIMTTPDPVSGATFATEEMVDQVAIFFLAGHETSASALAWALYLLAENPDWQARVATESMAAFAENPADFNVMAKLKLTRDVFREALRLYPPVPMMVRETLQPERFRARDVPRGAQIVLSPWHLHRHERLWDRPDEFDPARFGTPEGREAAKKAFIPFSEGPRVCPGAGFAMIEGPLLLAQIVAAYRLAPVAGRRPIPVAHLTVRAKDGIWLALERRDQTAR